MLLAVFLALLVVDIDDEDDDDEDEDPPLPLALPPPLLLLNEALTDGEVVDDVELMLLSPGCCF